MSIALACYTCRTKRVQNGLPRLEINEHTKNLGDVLPDSEHVVQYQLRNIGAAKLNLFDIKSSCGCMQPVVSKSTLGPGETGTMEVKITTPHHTKHISHSIVLHSNAPDQPMVRLAIVGDVRWPVEVSDESVQFHSVLQGETERKEIELFTPDASSFEVSRIETTVPWLKADVVLKSYHRQRFAVSVQSPPLGTFSESIRFYTNVKRRLLITVPVTGDVKVASVVVTPRLLLLGTVAPGLNKEAIVRLDVPPTLDMDLTVSDISISPKDERNNTLKIVDWQTKRHADSSIELRVSFLAPHLEGYYRTKLVVQIGKPPKQVSIPVSCLVVRPGKADKSKPRSLQVGSDEGNDTQ